MENELEQEIKNILTDYFKQEFGNENALPNLVLSGIAHELAKNGWKLYRIVQKQYDYEDIDDMAGIKDIELTKEEREEIYENYSNSEYKDSDTLFYLLEDLIEDRKKNDSEKGKRGEANAELGS